MTDFRARINAVLHGEPPDRVPFAPYDNLMPRGEFARPSKIGAWGCVTAARPYSPKCRT